jgi:hypothetical protein
MTIANATRFNSATVPTIHRGTVVFLERVGQLIDCWVAAAIANRARGAELAALRDETLFCIRAIGVIGASQPHEGARGTKQSRHVPGKRWKRLVSCA